MLKEFRERLERETRALDAAGLLKRERVIGSDTQADAREAVLRRATTEMVHGRTLRIDRAKVADDPSASAPLRQVWRAARPQRRVAWI